MNGITCLDTMQSRDHCNCYWIDKIRILSTFHDSWTIILWQRELPAIFELSDSIHRSCHTDGQINIRWANESKRNKKSPVFGKRRRSRGKDVENGSDRRLYEYQFIGNNHMWHWDQITIHWDQITIHWDQITIHWDQITIHWDQITIHGDRQKQAF